jgi:Family of unknown function (DUF6361)
MGSIFAWLDQSEEQRRKVLDVIDLFREQGTVDELGFGTIRDALADILFPATSNLMTRACYYFFIPWMYLRLEDQKTSSSEVAAKARREELKLIERLLDAGEQEGVIGRRARGGLRRLPSSIYWAGMKRLKICLFDGSSDSYNRSLDRFYQRQRMTVKTDDGERVGGGRENWNPRLPLSSSGWPSAGLALRRVDAEFLRDQIAMEAPKSLFAVLVRAAEAPSNIEFPWAHPHQSTFSETIQWQLSHARNISEATYGAALLYNLILAELTSSQERIDEYRGKLAEWAEMVNTRMPQLSIWDLSDAWRCVESEGALIPRQTRDFVDRWCELIMELGPDAMAESSTARTLVSQRERRLKGPLARVDNLRARELWQGASSSRRLQFRWGNAAVIIGDIISTLHEKPNA